MSCKISFIFLLFAILSSLDSIETKTIDDLLKWSRDKGIYLNNKLEIRETEESGRGFYAKARIMPDEILLNVPSNAILTPDRASSILLQFFDEEDLSEFVPDELMAFFLLFEKTRPASKSDWKPFIETMQKNFDTPIFWSKKELSELEGSSMLEFVKGRKENLRISYGILKKISSKYQDVLRGRKFSSDDWKWAMSVVWSRSFSVKVDGKASGGFVPLADLFNNGSPINVQHRMTNSFLELKASDEIQVNEQAFVPYGRSVKSNGELLFEYGFVLDEHPRDSTMIEIPQFSLEDPLYEQKMKIMKEMKIQNFVWIVEGSEELIYVCRLIHANEEELELQSTPESTYSLRNEKAALRTAIAHINKILWKYPTTLEDDMKMLSTPEFQSRSHMKSAIQLRASEKKILSQYLDYLENERSNVFNTPSLGQVNARTKNKKVWSLKKN